MHRFRRVISTLLCVFAAAAPAAAGATLRPMTTLHAQTVRLSDLFDDAGPRGGVVLGPGPAPGERIVVEAAQLAAIARQFGVDWQPASPGDRAVLDRPGRPLPREAIMAALQAALAPAGAGGDCDIDIAGFNPPMVPFEATPVPVVSQLDYDAVSGRFSALLSLTAPQMEPLDLRVAGRADPTMVVPVAVARLAAGSVVQPADLRLLRLRVGDQRDAVATSAAQVVGLALRHQLMAGQAVPMADLVPPTLVTRGGQVLMQLESPGIALTAEGMAMESGALGAHVRVLNPVSRAVLEADVIGPGLVRVEPGSMPVGPAGRAPAVAQVLR